MDSTIASIPHCASPEYHGAWMLLLSKSDLQLPQCYTMCIPSHL